MSYAPAPGSVPYRAIAYLQRQPAGAEVKTSVLAEAIGAPPASMNTCMEPARTAGLVFARQRDAHRTSPMWWSLVDHSNGVPPLRVPTIADLSETLVDAHAKLAVDEPADLHEPNTPQKGANRAAGESPRSTEQSHGAGGSESPAGRGDNVAPALGAAPASIPPEPGPQQVLKAEPATADATDRGAPDTRSPGGGPRGVGQPAAAGPTGDPPPLTDDEALAMLEKVFSAPKFLAGKTATVSMTGEVAIVAECGTVILFDAQRGRKLIEFIAGRAA